MSGTSKTTSAGAGGAGAVYGLGFIGALVYYWQSSDPTIWNHLEGIFEAIFWPAFVVYDLLVHLH
jgi:hypothetical protein